MIVGRSVIVYQKLQAVVKRILPGPLTKMSYGRWNFLLTTNYFLQSAFAIQIN